MHGLAIERPSPAAPIDRVIAVRRPGIAGRLAWWATGFLVGAAFWHLVGFWSFVSYAVLGGPISGGYGASARPAAVASTDQAPALYTPASGTRASCIALVLDRTTGQTRPEPCAPATVALPHVEASGREDLAMLREAHLPTILPKSDPAALASSRND
jgi:hypothetical protein